MVKDPCCEDAAANASVGEKESPLACNLGAFTVEEKPRYIELRKALATAVVGRRELPDGIALQVASDRVGLVEIAEWIAFERRCCPFFDFRIDLARESGPVWVSLTGRAGVKEFLTQSLRELALRRCPGDIS